MEKLELTKEQKKKLAKKAGATGCVWTLVLGIALLILLFRFRGHEMRFDDARYIVFYACVVLGIIIAISVFIRSKREAKGIFDGTTEVYKAMATATIEVTIEGIPPHTHTNKMIKAFYEDDINHNPPLQTSAEFKNGYLVERLYENTTGEKLRYDTHSGNNLVRCYI